MGQDVLIQGQVSPTDVGEYPDEKGNQVLTGCSPEGKLLPGFSQLIPESQQGRNCFRPCSFAEVHETLLQQVHSLYSVIGSTSSQEAL